MFSHVGRDATAGARFAAGWVDSDRTARFNGVNFVFKCRSPRALYYPSPRSVDNAR